MANFKSQSLWIRLAFVFMSVSAILYLHAYTISGWGTTGRGFKICPTNGGTCSADWIIPVEVCHVIAYFCSMAAFILMMLLVHFDEIKGDKRALIAFLVLAFLAGLLIIVGEILFRRYITFYTYSDCITLTSALVMIGGGIFGIVEMATGKTKVGP